MKKALLILLALGIVGFKTYVVVVVVVAKKRSDEILSQFSAIDKSLDSESIVSNDNKGSSFDFARLDQIILEADGIEVEFPIVWGQANSIPDDKDEDSFIGMQLKSMGFLVTNWGRGNFDKGPRIVNVTFQKADCECMVTKMYYSTAVDTIYDVKEKIVCKKIN